MEKFVTFLTENSGVLISGTITIIGFIVTYFMTKKNLKDEVHKIKQNKSIELMQRIPFEILEYFDSIKNANSDDLLLKLQNIISQVYAYGSVDAIKTLVAFQTLNYHINEVENKTDLLILLSILVSQIKYDITGEIINPTNWLKIKIRDYKETLEPLISNNVNVLINKYELNKKFKVEK